MLRHLLVVFAMPDMNQIMLWGWGVGGMSTMEEGCQPYRVEASCGGGAQAVEGYPLNKKENKDRLIYV